MNMITRLTALAALLSVTLSATAEEGNACPPKIAVSQSISMQIPGDWSAYGTQKEHPFVAVSFFSGAPDQKMMLAPTSEKKRGKNIVATWTFTKSGTDYWVACEYAGTTVVVAKALSKNTSSCRAVFDGRFSSPVTKLWNCDGGETK